MIRSIKFVLVILLLIQTNFAFIQNLITRLVDDTQDIVKDAADTAGKMVNDIIGNSNKPKYLQPNNVNGNSDGISGNSRRSPTGERGGDGSRNY